MGKTGGGRGTNQHQIKGVSLQRSASPGSRYRATRAEGDLGPIAEHYAAVPLEQFSLLTDRPPGLALQSSTPARSVARYRARRADIAFSNAYLEGNTFTLPEVYTLLEGQVPPGKSESDTEQVLGLARASEQLLDWVEDGTFRIDLDHSDQLNAILAKHEVIEPGVRRAYSSINRDGRGATVNLMGDEFTGMGKAELARAEAVLMERTRAERDPVLRAVNYAAMATYMQMYFDGNKRTARYMADGQLMAQGFDSIAIPASRHNEYHESLAAMFKTADAKPYAMFLLDVIHRGDPVQEETSG